MGHEIEAVRCSDDGQADNISDRVTHMDIDTVAVVQTDGLLAAGGRDFSGGGHHTNEVCRGLFHDIPDLLISAPPMSPSAHPCRETEEDDGGQAVKLAPGGQAILGAGIPTCSAETNARTRVPQLPGDRA
jgi:hypothetical protein